MADVRRITHWIGGKSWDGEAARGGDVFDPATGELTGRVDFAGPEEVDAAVAAARGAWQEWRQASLTRRAQVLFAFREIVLSVAHRQPPDYARSVGAAQLR